MPLKPSFWNRIQRRVRGASPSSEDEAISPGLWTRLKRRVQTLFGKERPEQEGPTGQTPSDYRAMITHAGQTRTKLLMKYNGQYRHVIPLSFRFKSRGTQPLLYGECLLHHGNLHAFRLDRIQGLWNTDETFTFTYGGHPVEF
jgi:hypothetical protein